MNSESTAVHLELLRSWVPQVLSFRRRTPPEAIAECLRLRLSFEFGEAPDLFFALNEVDKECARWAPTLLYIPLEEAEWIASDCGSRLNPLTWYGIHLWEQTQYFEIWAGQLDLVDVHSAEVGQALLELGELRGGDFTNTFLVDSWGNWRKELEEEEMVWLKAHIEHSRSV